MPPKIRGKRTVQNAIYQSDLMAERWKKDPTQRLQIFSRFSYCKIIHIVRAVLMGTKSCTKILIFSTRFLCENLAVEDFVTLLMGKKSCWWGNLMFGHDFGILVYALLCGGDTKFKLPKAGNGNVFFPNKRVRFARADKAVALQYHNQWSTDTNVCGGFTLGVIVGRWTQAQPGKNALLQSFLYTTCKTTGRRRTDVVVYWLQNSTAFKLAPPGKRGSLGLEWLEGLLYQTPGTFSQQTLLEALIVTGWSASYFGEQ